MKEKKKKGRVKNLPRERIEKRDERVDRV